MFDKAFNELQVDERSARSINAAETSAGIQRAEDDYKAKSRPLMPGKFGQMQKNQQAQDLAEIRNKIRRGADPKAAVEEKLKEREMKRQAVPTQTNRVLELDK